MMLCLGWYANVDVVASRRDDVLLYYDGPLAIRSTTVAWLLGVRRVELFLCFDAKVHQDLDLNQVQ